MRFIVFSFGHAKKYKIKKTLLMMNKIKISGKKIILKIMEEEDASKFFKNIDNPKISQYSGPYSATSIEKAKEYIKKCSDEIKDKKSCCLGIYSKENKQLIGSIGLINFDKKRKQCETGFWIGVNYWGKGFMTEAVNLLTEYGFDKLGVSKIYAYSHNKNIASKKILQKCGFKKKTTEIQKPNEICYIKLSEN